MREYRSQTYPYMLSAKQGSIWYHFHKYLDMTQSEFRTHNLPLTGRTLYHWADAAVFVERDGNKRSVKASTHCFQFPCHIQYSCCSNTVWNILKFKKYKVQCTNDSGMGFLWWLLQPKGSGCIQAHYLLRNIMIF